MKNKRFASYLLTGKAATLPLLFQQALAADPPKGTGVTVQPNADNILGEAFNIVQRPSPGAFELVNGPYGPVPTLCTNTSVPGFISTVLTGLRPGDTAFVVTSTKADVDTSPDLRLSTFNPSIEIGTENVLVVAAVNFNPTPIKDDGSDLTKLSGTITLPISIDKMKAKGYNVFQSGGRFYMQAIVLPAGADPNDLSKYRYSKMNRFDVGKCATSYGGVY